MEVGAVSGSFLGDTVGSAQMFKGMSEVGALQGTQATRTRGCTPFLTEARVSVG